MESAGTLTVKTHGLSEGLGNHHLEALSKEETETVRVFVKRARGEALVGGVEEGIELVALANIRDLLPLFFSGIDTSGVVSTGVKKHTGTSLGGLEVSKHTFNIKTSGLGVVVSVFMDFDSASSKDGVVVSPSRVAQVNWSWSESR